MVHQHFTLVPVMTVAENVALGGHGMLDLHRTISGFANSRNARASLSTRRHMSSYSRSLHNSVSKSRRR